MQKKISKNGCSSLRLDFYSYKHILDCNLTPWLVEHLFVECFTEILNNGLLQRNSNSIAVVSFCLKQWQIIMFKEFSALKVIYIKSIIISWLALLYLYA